MSQGSPPPAPLTQAEDNPQKRIDFRLWQIVMASVTVIATVWCFKLHPIIGIIATFIAKHVLVAILATGLTKLPNTPSPIEPGPFPPS